MIACLCSSGDWLWSDKTSCPWTATPENRVHGLRGQSNIYRTITICRKPPKLFINKPPDIISERWWCATAVIIWQLSQSSLICQFWPSGQGKMDQLSCRFASVARHAATIDISLACQIIDDAIGRALIPFQSILGLVLLRRIGTQGVGAHPVKLPR